MLNRSVIIVRPAQPFLDWAATLDDSGLVPDAGGEQTVYLVPDFEDDDEAAEVLDLVYAEIFERELDSWHTTTQLGRSGARSRRLSSGLRSKCTRWLKISVVTGLSMTMSNYALERSVKPCGWRAARVRRDFTLAARWNGLARTAQRGR